MKILELLNSQRKSEGFIIGIFYMLVFFCMNDYAKVILDAPQIMCCIL